MSSMTTDAAIVVEPQPFGGSALAQAMYAGTLPPALDARALTGRAAIVASARAVQARFVPAQRQALREWLERATALSAAAPAAAMRLRAALERGLLVTTGQQPGLFGGPLYTWHKALSAIALADALQAELDVPVAPLFWAATDDADFVEGQSTWLPTANGAVRASMATVDDATGSRPVSALPLPALHEALAAFDAACGSAAAPQVRDAVHAAYQPPRTVGDAYVQLLRALLEPHGMAVVDASHVALRTAAHPITTAALREASRVDAALDARDVALRSAGHTPQVERVAGQSLVFAWDAAGKSRVSVAEAAAHAARAEPGSLSGNVLLRPVIERALLPTVAYVAGPGELAYFAQLGAVAETLGLDVPRAVARWSARIIEPRVRRALEALAVPERALADPDHLLHQLARAGLPPALAAALASGRASLAACVDQVRASADGLHVPEPVLVGAHRRLQHDLDRLERRIVAHASREDAARRARVHLAAGTLYPGGVPQERALNALPLLARFGDALWEAWRGGAAAWAAALLDA